VNTLVPTLRAAAECVPYRIAPGDTVRLAPAVEPDGEGGPSVFYEIWDVGGAQPPNAHPLSDELFVILAGTGRAEVGDTTVEVHPGDVVRIPAGSTHRFVNTGPDRLYAVTVMLVDDGFAAYVRRGEPGVLDDADLEVLTGRTGGS